ncbi:adenosylcobinamide-phosphate synthase CbiB [Oricola cellulosilytica]|uniref:Cobalamin biosynthesis protein CobD n=1 Tax=Oricola cellulosilytica TaxID=1429082 RepID=A0A4R0PF41_9HYPH|nr:adenosylcobinamide-phosphate synthase CbiB [Oricola cellulosilytica]TCD15005.1 cobalamin biosynthesis protein [Oricola cellulosilytica]
MTLSTNLVILLAALIADRIAGDPEGVWDRIPHPVVVFGRLIGFCDERFNRPDRSDDWREKSGFLSIAGLLVVASIVGAWLADIFDFLGIVGMIAEVAVVAVFLAQKSLADHVGAVAAGLRDGGLEGGRKAVSMIVGRDPATLDEAGISRAAIESLAENASDGVVAPAFWYGVFGLPGLFAYKMLNTADSMIGHKSEKYRAFGKASAKLDDLANWVPARLSGMLIVTADAMLRGTENAKKTYEVMRQDANLHRSPNAGWPESAMAGALGISLGGPRVYADDIADEPFLNAAGRRDVGQAELDMALRIYWRAMTVFAGVVAGLALLAA